MTAKEVINQLKPLGAESYRKVLLNHGIQPPLFGVKIGELKKIVQKVKKDHDLALELFDSGIYDAMYLAGLIADDARMTQKDLRHWAKSANCHLLSECTVAWVAAESPHGFEMAREWIDSKQEKLAATGWATLSGLVAIRKDEELEMSLLKDLLRRVETTIHKQPNRVRSTMNHFVIALGSYVKELTAAALKAGAKIGPVMVDVGNTACKVPSAGEQIEKVLKRGAIGKKRKTVKC